MSEYTTKDFVLKELELNRGNYITGSALAKAKGVSRNAIWKAISDLRNDGYNIEAVSNKGYMLEGDSDIISIAGIESYLSQCTTLGDADIKHILSQIAIYDELPSTNRAAKMNLIMDELQKRIIIARTQTSGQGHSGSRYDSPEGGIYLSIILTPDEIKKSPIKTTRIGSRVGDIISEITGKTITYDKKTNRIYIGKKKVSGILTEYFADLETSEISGYVIGIGIKYPKLPKNKTIALLLNSFYSDYSI